MNEEEVKLELAKARYDVNQTSNYNPTREMDQPIINAYSLRAIARILVLVVETEDGMQIDRG